MGEKTGITWCDATFNPWIGCTKVSQGCKYCYAETQNIRYNWNPAGWGSGSERKRTSPANWKKPFQWARQAIADNVIRRVFCASLADVFDEEVPPDWRTDLWELIRDCAYLEETEIHNSGLEWLLLTKRPENIRRMLPDEWLHHPPYWIRLGVTAEDQENADKRIPELLVSWHGKNFISYEPAIGPIGICFADPFPGDIDWVICGGESGAGCRPMNLNWARYMRDQCQNANIPFFMKQLGGHPNKRHDPAEWPEDLRVQEFPAGN